MSIQTSYASVSGPVDTSCVFLGYRFDSDIGFRPREIESWIMSTEDDGTDEPLCGCQYGAARWYTGLWRSSSGTVYVVDGDGDAHVNPNVRAQDSHTRWTRTPLKASLFGVFGIDDQHVWAWGQRKVTTGVMFRWDGARWSEIPAPDFDVVQVHGPTPDLLFAVGRAGGVARWDGTSWRKWSIPVAENLTSVFVVSEDEIYATGDRGSLLEGTKHGWAKVAQGPGPGTPLLGVAKWQGQLWIAAGPFGLLRRVGTTDQLEVVKEKVLATSFDAREHLLITDTNRIVSTSDGQSFSTIGDDMLFELRDGHELLDVI